jgi:hypothetical protein
MSSYWYWYWYLVLILGFLASSECLRCVTNSGVITKESPKVWDGEKRILHI